MTRLPRLRRRRWARLAGLPLVVALTVTTACTSSQRSVSDGGVVITASPARALLDRPVHVTVSGLDPGQRATVSAIAEDADGIPWRSSATFAAAADGVVDFSGAPLAGSSYRGAEPMGLFDHLRPRRPPSSSVFLAPRAGYDVRLVASVDGHAVAHATVRRLTATSVGVRMRHLTVDRAGVDANLYRPGHVDGDVPAVLLFGGSEGGLSETFDAEMLAAHGYPTMALAYFAGPGLPPTLDRIPLEYFVHALRLLDRQRGVDPRRVVVLGASRGSEAALMLGADYPRLVDGVVAAVPSSVANPSFPGGRHAAWTIAGHPVPTVPHDELDIPHPTDHRAAIIPVERIRGPVLLVCGGHDLVWRSCPYENAIARRLRAHHHRAPVVALHYPAAGHLVGQMFPYVSRVPGPAQFDGHETGGTSTADAVGGSDAWQHLLALLRRLRP